MKPVVYFQRTQLEATARSGHMPNIKRAISAVEDKVAIFTKLVPWPALAASFQRDLNLLQSVLDHEPQDRQSPPRVRTGHPDPQAGAPAGREALCSVARAEEGREDALPQ